MNPPVSATSLNQPFTGWDELRSPGAAWKIEKPQPRSESFVPFFPDQNGKVYEMLLANLPVMLHCMDGTGRITSVNKHWAAALGYSQDAVAGKSFNDLLAPESRSRLVQEVYPKYLQSGACHHELITVLRRDGSPVQLLLSMTAYRGDKGRIERSVCLLDQPVSVSVSQPTAVVDDPRFRAAFDSCVHGMALVSPTGEVSIANAAFWDFTGRTPDLSVAFDETVHADDRGQLLARMSELIKGGLGTIRQELRYPRPDGRIMHGETTIALLRNDKDEISQLTVQIVDMTEKQDVAKSLQRAQKMEAIGQLTGGLAHDFNNLLTVIIGNLELLEGKLPDDRSTKRLSEAITAARKGSDLTRQMLAFARKQVLEPREVQLNDLVTDLAPLLSRTIGEMVQLKVAVMDGEPKAIIDPSQLESAILNLAINARDAMPKGGHLTIETQPVYLDQAYATKFPEVTPGHYVLVAVSDTGAGMSAELLERVFQPFFTTKTQGKGSGLGLSMVYGFIKQSGGHISIYSEVGHGTAVKMYLPRKFAPGEAVPDVAGVASVSDAPAEIADLDVPAARKPKILVVEDQEAVRAVACGFLEDFGYDIVEAEDGLQALAKLQETPDIDLMFSDVVMPGGLNGFDLAQAARGIRPDLKIVHTSGYPKGAMVHQEEPRFREGFIIMKPYRREDLQKIVRDALEIQA
ncbi:MAG: PAS domain S-box protein [Hyphomicrobiales bacterium]